MNQIVYKYELPNPMPYNKKQFSLKLPMEFKILTVGTQSEHGVLWIAIDPDAKTWQEDFIILGTGVKDNLSGKEFVGTFFIGSYVWHVFRRLSGEY